VAYTVRAEVRGRYEVGPLMVRLTDPFGLCELSRSFTTVIHMTVVPQVVGLPNVRLAGEYAGSGDSRARSVAVHGEDDIATREYRDGDDLRRVHWRSTARTGELMVRREEQPWESKATIVLDTRRQGHRGEGPTSSFEWAVSAAASVGVHLRRNGYKLRMVTGNGADIDAGERDADGVLLDALAEVDVSPNADINVLVERVRHRSDGGLVIAVLGGLSIGEAEKLGQLRASGTTCVALLVDPNTWLNLPEAARAQTNAHHEAAALTLIRSGWRVVNVEHGPASPRCGRWRPAARRASPGGPRWRRPWHRREACNDAPAFARPGRRGGHHPRRDAADLGLRHLDLAHLHRRRRRPRGRHGDARTDPAGTGLGPGARMLAVLLLYLTWAFPSGGEIAAIIPTGETFANFGKLLSTAGTDIRDQAVPVPDRDGLLLLTTGGVVLVAILVDLFAVALRRPALAGTADARHLLGAGRGAARGVNIFSFCFAAAGFLWLLVSDSVDRVRRFGRRFSGEGRDVDLWEPSPLSSAGRRLGLVGVVIAILIPLAIPGMTTGFLDRFGTGPGGGDGPGNGTGVGAAKLDLTALLHGNLVRKEAFEMVRVKTTDPNPFYARIGVAEQVTNQGFDSIVPNGGGATVTRPLPEYVVPTKPGVTSTAYRAEIEVVNLDSPLAPSYQQVIGVSGLDSAWFVDEPTGQVFSKRTTVQGKRYIVDFLRLTYTAAALRTAGTIPANDTGARALTRVPIIPEVTDLVEQLTRGKTTEYDKVRAIYDYFGTGFSYSLSAVDGPSESPIVDFLTAKRGYCLQYAAAMGVAGPRGRLPGPGRVRLDPRHRCPQRCLLADQPQPARLDRGVLPGLRLGALRRDAAQRRARFLPVGLGAGPGRLGEQRSRPERRPGRVGLARRQPRPEPARPAGPRQQ
jgi:hypothetical protein